MTLSHTAAHVVLFPFLLRVPWYQAPWPTSTQGFSDPIRLLFRRGGERAELKFSYIVAVIFVSSQVLITQQSSSTPANTSTWSRTPFGVSSTQPARLRWSTQAPRPETLRQGVRVEKTQIMWSNVRTTSVG